MARQTALGIDIVSDGETAKIGYATYIKDRLSGFGGDSPRQIARDLQPYPEFRARMAVFAGSQTFKRESCIGDIEFTGYDDLNSDIRRMRDAVDLAAPGAAFLNAASPGVVAAFQPNAQMCIRDSSRSSPDRNKSMVGSPVVTGCPQPATCSGASRRAANAHETGSMPTSG